MKTNVLQGPTSDYTPNSTIGEFFFDLTEKHGNKICHIDAITNEEETYHDILLRSTRLALSMLKRGVNSQDVIMTCSSVTLDVPVSILAAFYLGAKVANLDPTLSVRQISHLLSLVSPKVLFVEDTFVQLIEDSLQHAQLRASIIVFGKSSKYATFSSIVVEQPEEKMFRPVTVDLQDTAIMFFSSGTTGLPKAICHSHQSFLHLVNSFYKSGGHFETVLVCSSFYWISGMLLLSASFTAGGRRIISSVKWKPEEIFRCVDKYKVTYMFLAPILISQMMAVPDYHKYNTSSVSSVLSGGTAMSNKQILKFHDIFKQTNLIFAYGLTETGLVTLLNPETDQKLFRTKIGSSGKPSLGATIKIVDVKSRKILGAHEKGEICIKTLAVMKGYHQTDCTQEFDDDGYFKTGDVGFYDEDNCIYIVERLKEMFKYLSWHIVPSSLEGVLLEHPDVKEAVVFGLPRSEEEGEVPTACVVLKSDGSVTEEEIQSFVAAQVSDRERLRGGVYFLKELSRTPSGKLMRREIKNYIINYLKQGI